MKCRWKRVPGYSYDISEFGQLRRAIGGRGTFVGRMIKPNIGKKDGRRYFSLYRNGKQIYPTAARLMALAFLGLPPTAKHQAAHKDGNCTRDVLSNIKWATPSENTLDKDQKGENNPHAKLNAADVRLMRSFRVAGVSIEILANAFGVGTTTCSDAVAGRSWSHIK